MKTKHLGLFALAASLGLMPMAQAQDVSSAGARNSSAGQAGKTFNMRASQIIGKEVRNSQGENLGKIQDLFVDAQSQRVYYAALSFDPGIASEEKLFAYPMGAFKLARDRGEMLLDVPRERLAKAPGFARDSWPNYGDSSYFADVRRYFNEPEQTGRPAAGMLRGSELIGRGVNDRRGNDAGEVQDFVVDIGRGRISYVVLDFDKAWSLDDKLLPMPLSAFSLPKERGGELVLNIERDRLDMARGFEQNAWPDLNAPAFDQDMRAYFLALERPRDAGGAGQGNSSGASR